MRKKRGLFLGSGFNQGESPLPFRGALVTKVNSQAGADYSAGANIGFDQEEYDTNGFHDNAVNNDRLSVTTGTKARLTGSVSLSNMTGNGDVYVSIFKNGSFAYAGVASVIMDTSATVPRATLITPVLSVVAGVDYFTLNLTTSGDASVTVAEDQTWFAIEVIE